AMISIVSHEYNEAITDWDGAWLDSAGYEIGDECAYVYGNPVGGSLSSGTAYNQVINGDHYFTQDEFSNFDFANGIGDFVSPNYPTTQVPGCVQHPTASSPPVVTSISPTSGPASGGTVVTISGENLSGASAVDFGTSAATAVSCTQTSCSATSPAGTGTVNVTVTTPDGTSATSSSDEFTYVPRPVVSKLSPDRGPTGGGTVVTITGKYLSQVTAVHFGSHLGKIDDRVSSTEIKVTAPAGSGTVYVTVHTAGGTSATSSADKYTYVPRPVVSKLSPDKGPTGGGTVVTITGKYLSQVTAVHFGSHLGKIDDRVSSTEIKVTAPAGSGTVYVTVHTAGGTSAAASSDKYTYVPRPVVSKLSPDRGPTGGGTVVTITGKYLSQVTAVHFGSHLGKIDDRVSSTEIKVTAPSGSGTVYVTVTSSGGTSAAASADRYFYD
ncbi:MAG TPA: IPT/TIG domain-containing protein, partial [Acidimicrobiales bacterium]|nr:IPT/TIG domain-containing protein [Acidimicrobiales bacterium]